MYGVLVRVCACSSWREHLSNLALYPTWCCCNLLLLLCVCDACVLYFCQLDTTFLYFFNIFIKSSTSISIRNYLITKTLIVERVSMTISFSFVNCRPVRGDIQNGQLRKKKQKKQKHCINLFFSFRFLFFSFHFLPFLFKSPFKLVMSTAKIGTMPPSVVSFAV